MVDTLEIENMISAIAGFDNVLMANLKQGAFIAGAEIQRKARELVPKDTNQLGVSIQNTVSVRSQVIGVEVGPTQPYGYKVEHGQPPGTYVAPALLRGWAQRHGLNEYAVSKAIEKRGTKAQPFMQPAGEESEQKVVDILTQAVVNAIRQLRV